MPSTQNPSVFTIQRAKQYKTNGNSIKKRVVFCFSFPGSLDAVCHFHNGVKYEAFKILTDLAVFHRAGLQENTAAQEQTNSHVPWCPPKTPDEVQKQQLDPVLLRRSTVTCAGRPGCLRRIRCRHGFQYRSQPIYRDFCINAYLTFQSHWKRTTVVTRVFQGVPAQGEGRSPRR